MKIVSLDAVFVAREYIYIYIYKIASIHYSRDNRPPENWYIGTHEQTKHNRYNTNNDGIQQQNILN